MKIKVIVPRGRVVEKKLKTKKGDDFTIIGINVGDKFVRLVHGQDRTLPDGDLECNLYARKYETARGEFSELALYVENTIDTTASEEPSEEV